MLIEIYGQKIRSATRSFDLPAVIVLNRYVKFRLSVVSPNRINVLSRDNNRCQYCAKTFPERELTLDHIIPKFSSGSSHRNNLITACRTCNQTKASLNMEEWYRMQDFFDEEKLHKIQEWVKEDMSDLMIYSSSKPQVNLAIS